MGLDGRGWVEWAFATHWTLKGEYLHVDLGSLDGVSRPVSPYFGDGRRIPFKHRMDDLTADLARAGLNYKF